MCLTCGQRPAVHIKRPHSLFFPRGPLSPAFFYPRPLQLVSYRRTIWRHSNSDEWASPSRPVVVDVVSADMVRRVQTTIRKHEASTEVSGTLSVAARVGNWTVQYGDIKRYDNASRSTAWSAGSRVARRNEQNACNNIANGHIKTLMNVWFASLVRNARLRLQSVSWWLERKNYCFVFASCCCYLRYLKFCRNQETVTTTKNYKLCIIVSSNNMRRLCLVISYCYVTAYCYNYSTSYH